MTDNTMAKGQQEKQWQTIQWLKESRTNNEMAKGQQDKQWQKIQWLKDNKTNNDRQYNG